MWRTYQTLNMPFTKKWPFVQQKAKTTFLYWPWRQRTGFPGQITRSPAHTKVVNYQFLSLSLPESIRDDDKKWNYKNQIDWIGIGFISKVQSSVTHRGRPFSDYRFHFLSLENELSRSLQSKHSIFWKNKTISPAALFLLQSLFICWLGWFASLHSMLANGNTLCSKIFIYLIVFLYFPEWKSGVEGRTRSHIQVNLVIGDLLNFVFLSLTHTANQTV